jgi:hypothetical protein
MPIMFRFPDRMLSRELFDGHHLAAKRAIATGFFVVGEE